MVVLKNIYFSEKIRQFLRKYNFLVIVIKLLLNHILKNGNLFLFKIKMFR